jgi:hypothetical protein
MGDFQEFSTQESSCDQRVEKGKTICVIQQDSKHAATFIDISQEKKSGCLNPSVWVGLRRSMSCWAPRYILAIWLAMEVSRYKGVSRVILRFRSVLVRRVDLLHVMRDRARKHTDGRVCIVRLDQMGDGLNFCEDRRNLFDTSPSELGQMGHSAIA